MSDHWNASKSDEAPEILRWLSTLPNQEYHRSMARDRLSHSGAWLFERQEYLDWNASALSSILWLHGIPGSGKSKLVSCVVDRLLLNVDACPNPDAMAAFYYVRSPAEPQRSDPDEILRNILKQLYCSTSDQSYREPVMKAYEERRLAAKKDCATPAKLILAEAVELIIEMSQHEAATIVIDALDECDPYRRHELLQALDEIIQRSAKSIKIVASSRDDVDITCRLKHSPNVIIHATNNQNDIERFVNQELRLAIERKRILCGAVSSDLEDKIRHTLTRNAQGILSLQTLYRINLESALLDELGSLPKELADLYDIVFRQISQSDFKKQKDIGVRAIKWLLCALRPLSTNELLAAISVDSEGRCEQSALSVNGLLGVCCNLVVVDQDSNVIRFAHLSVREYLESRQESLFRLVDCNVVAAERCIDLWILKSQKKRPATQLEEHNKIFDPYATLYWPEHCTSALSEINPRSEIIKTKMLQFLFNGTNVAFSFMTWLTAARKLKNRPKQIDEANSPSPQFLACCYGLDSIIEQLDSIGRREWGRKSQGLTCLQLAVIYGHEKTVRRLIDIGAVVDEGQAPPLFLAVAGKQESMVKILLECGAKIGAVCDGGKRHGKSALHEAVLQGSESMISVLLSNGASCRIFWQGTTVLHLAAIKGSTTMMGQLLDYTRWRINDIEREEGSTMTILHLAVCHGHVALVEFLLNAGANIEFRATYRAHDKMTPLMIAVASAQVDMVSLLLSWKANTTTMSAPGFTVLHFAVNLVNPNGLAILETLLSNGADANARSTTWDDYPIHHGADINTRTGTQRTAINTASEIISQLIKTKLLLGLNRTHEEVTLAYTGKTKAIGGFQIASIILPGSSTRDPVIFWDRGLFLVLKNLHPSAYSQWEEKVFGKAIQVLVDNGADPCLTSPFEWPRLTIGYPDETTSLVSNGADQTDSNSLETDDGLHCPMPEYILLTDDYKIRTGRMKYPKWDDHLWHQNQRGKIRYLQKPRDLT
ncbi:hypothetical protein MMC18_008277 [Xylographa bjoerkii]|nr:hypothetical protein [Xylographa bjoerkii]